MRSLLCSQLLAVHAELCRGHMHCIHNTRLRMQSIVTLQSASARKDSTIASLNSKVDVIQRDLINTQKRFNEEKALLTKRESELLTSKAEASRLSSSSSALHAAIALLLLTLVHLFSEQRLSFLSQTILERYLSQHSLSQLHSKQKPAAANCT